MGVEIRVEIENELKIEPNPGSMALLAWLSLYHLHRLIMRLLVGAVDWSAY